MVDPKIKYSTAFTSGALLLRETEAYVSAINSLKDFLDGNESIDYNIIPVNAESSKKRLKNEIEKRVQAINNERLLNTFLTSDKNGKISILFYGICKCYPIIKHFMLEVVLKKWQNLDYELDISDFTNFLYRKMDFHPELQKITEKTIYKSGQVALKMLVDLGMLHKNKIQKTAISNTILRECANAGDLWFLDVLLLNEIEKQEI
ncbi:BrxA family protein [Flavobacterium magnesitis]|uniref:BrxA family protein n=1 Tax=Flavobacterium magnesitis TaxID=3138077 RepID=UPI00358F5D51